MDALRGAPTWTPCATSRRAGASWRAGRRARCATSQSFLDRVGDEWLEAAPAAAERVHFTGRLEHEDLPDLLPACEAQVMPSTFPEAFGMVAAEAAACGALPLSANHSGMAEVTATLAPALPQELRPLLVLRGGARSGGGDRGQARGLALPGRRRRASGRARRWPREAAGRYGWESVAEGVIAAAQGRLEELPSPAPPADSVPDP